MKRLSTIISLLSLSTLIFAHPGHGHHDMAADKFIFHVLFIATPIVVGAGIFLLSKIQTANENKQQSRS